MRDPVSASPATPSVSDAELGQPEAVSSSEWPPPRNRFALMGVALLLLSLLAGGVSLANTPVDDVIKIVAVAMFVCSMVALALAMVGDAHREP